MMFKTVMTNCPIVWRIFGWTDRTGVFVRQIFRQSINRFSSKGVGADLNGSIDIFILFLYQQIMILPSLLARVSPFNEYSISIRQHKYYKKLGSAQIYIVNRRVYLYFCILVILFFVWKTYLSKIQLLL